MRVRRLGRIINSQVGQAHKWFLHNYACVNERHFEIYLYALLLQIRVGRDSSVVIATVYGGGRAGDRIPVEARFSAPVQTGPEAHPASCIMGTGSFPG